MDKKKIPLETKALFGRLLGEMYRLQRHLDMPSSSEATVYGLMVGIEEAIDKCLPETFIGHEAIDFVSKVLGDIHDHEKKRASFKGYYDIETQLKAAGIDRGAASKILTYLYSNGDFTELIEKMDSSGSPSEMRRFEVPSDLS